MLKTLMALGVTAETIRKLIFGSKVARGLTAEEICESKTTAGPQGLFQFGLRNC